VFSLDDLIQKKQYKYALLHLGFRPFFLAASIFSCFAMFIWFLLLNNQFSGLFNIAPQNWHAHEMIYGFALAVIAGFLLTATKNWTSIQTLHQTALLILVSLWLSARLMPFMDVSFNMHLMAVLDFLFLAYLIYAIASPVIKVKQWQHLSLISCLLFMFVGNLFFYAGVLGVLKNGVHWSNYTGLYAVLGVLFIMGRRVIPFFIEKGVDQKITINNRRWLDISVAVLFILFAILDVFMQMNLILVLLASMLFVLHVIRLFDWYHKSLFQKPLLWVLYVAYCFMAAGFALSALSYIFQFSPSLALHAFAVGGVGIMTLGMMARVALGHTGRNVFDPPTILKWLFLLVFVAALVRVFFPLINNDWYPFWVMASQWLWLIAFLLFAWHYTPMLIKARVDGKYG